ncbi:sugar transferase [Ferrimonas marina]|uniref:Sugar transferase involved in LPS biosynthesis (Colanic, teichoic acid) n=1 Tax=Ferrimonas marina TaxID=299255 RepID=A0A1M5RTK0_9GAMM|nr:sugar transferase [Ferrimonas marina]SHH29520.1 Sugar transferase involved in LPS biosynthesis (colanic, teichoic acid) [Ferrimonas marina]
MLTAIACVICLSLVVYQHLGFPWLLQRWQRRHSVEPLPPEPEQWPSIELVMPAYNEAEQIEAKLINLALLDYPQERLTITVICDGCSDDTPLRAQRRLARLGEQAGHIRLQVMAENQGKVAVLNQALAQSQAEILALTDVSALVSLDALKVAARRFEDAELGVVCGHYHLLNPGSEGEQRYWQYQRRVKQGEAALGAPMGAHGAFYLMRRRWVNPLPADSINDDFLLPMALVQAGHSSCYESRINALELEQASDGQDRQRRRRIGAGNLQQLLRLYPLMHPRFGGIALAFFSGKALRVMMPLLMMATLLLSTLMASQGPLWLVLWLGQLMAYSLALLPRLAPLVAWPNSVNSLNYLVEGHLANLAGMAQYLGLPSLPRGHWRFALVLKLKRGMDLLLSALLLVLTLPLWPLIALAIGLSSPGPILYRQRRVGRMTDSHTELFEMVKLRTMVVDAERHGAVWAGKRDPRITPIGNFLRKTRLDELPQLLNVLKGDMSLVGPRPERPEFYAKLEQAIPFYRERTFGLRPGITGLAQVNQGYDTCIEDVRRKVGFDHRYALSLFSLRSWLWMELQVIFRTVWVMVMGRGQ